MAQRKPAAQFITRHIDFFEIAPSGLRVVIERNLGERRERLFLTFGSGYVVQQVMPQPDPTPGLWADKCSAGAAVPWINEVV